MLEELYKIFKECFPATLISKEEFEKKLDFNDSKVLKEYDENNNLIGYSIIRENCISLICVKPEFQRKGHGTKLLLESEGKIRESGFKEILLGYKADSTSLYMGVPILNNVNYNFFTKHQYDSDFVSYDVSIPKNIPIEVPSTEDINQYTTINTLEYPGVKGLFMQLLETIDKKTYDRYFMEEEMQFIFCRNKNKLVGVCAYKVLDELKTISIMDLIAYPNFDLNSKKIMLGEVRKVQEVNNIENLCVRNVSNPILYQQEFQGGIRQKYWRGSKSC